jgi:6-phosphofructokinase 2
VNVARVIQRLGGKSTALIVVGGATGQQLEQLLACENIKIRAVRTENNTRQSFAVMDTTTGEQYRFSLPGETVEPRVARQIQTEILECTQKDDFVVFSGSLPPGLPTNYYAPLVERLAPKTNRVIIDTSGPVLGQLIESPSGPILVLRMDQKEASAAAGLPVETAQESADFAKGLIARGVAEIVVIGQGAKGSLMVTKDQKLFCSPPIVPVRSPIGAGDAFVGAMTLALSRGHLPQEALQMGVAAATATVVTEGTALCRFSDVERLLPDCTLGSL